MRRREGRPEVEGKQGREEGSGEEPGMWKAGTGPTGVGNTNAKRQLGKGRKQVHRRREGKMQTAWSQRQQGQGPQDALRGQTLTNDTNAETGKRGAQAI